MFLRSLAAPLTAVRGIGPAVTPKLARLGIRGAAGLLCHYPRDWEDRSRGVPIKDFRHSRVCTEVTVIAHDWIGFGRMKTLKVHVEDASGRAALLCFNRPWLEKQLVSGRRYRLWGRFYYKYGEIQSSAFETEPVVPGEIPGNPAFGPAFGRLLPVYSLTAGLTQAALRRFIARALAQYAGDLEDELPAEITGRDNLLSKAAAIREIHFPASAAALERAKKTLIYEELFYLEILVGRRALARKKSAARPAASRSRTCPRMPSLLLMRLTTMPRCRGAWPAIYLPPGLPPTAPCLVSPRAAV